MPEAEILEKPVGSRKELIEATANFRTREGAAEYIDRWHYVSCAVTLVFEAT